MLSKVTLANAAGEDVVIHEDTPTSRRLLIDAKGLVGVGPLRESKRVRPSAHGSINETSFEEGRTIQLTGEVWSQASIEAALEEFRKVVQPMLETLDNGPALLKWTEGSTGLKKQMLVTLDSEVEPTLAEAQQFLNYPVSFFAEDPRAYSQAETNVGPGASVTSASATSTELTTIANGKRPIAVLVDASFIYWIDGLTAAIGRMTLAGGSQLTEWVKTAEPPICIAINGTNVFWGTAGGKIGRCTIAGATIENEWWKPNREIRCMALTTTKIYWGTNRGAASEEGKRGEIWTRELAGGGAQGVGTWQVPNIAAMAADANFVYWGTTAQTIERIKVNLGGLEQFWIAGIGVSPAGLAVSASFIYWLGTDAKVIGRATIAGATVEPLFMNGLMPEPGGLAVNAEHLYFSDTDSAGEAAMARTPTLAASASGGGITVAQAGNRRTPLIFTIREAVRNPSIVRTSDNARIVLKCKLTVGHVLQINTATRTVTEDGVPAPQFVDPQTNWAAFEAAPSPASQTYILTGNELFSTTLEAAYRSAHA